MYLAAERSRLYFWYSFCNCDIKTQHVHETSYHPRENIGQSLPTSAEVLGLDTFSAPGSSCRKQQVQSNCVLHRQVIISDLFFASDVPLAQSLRHFALYLMALALLSNKDLAESRCEK